MHYHQTEARYRRVSSNHHPIRVRALGQFGFISAKVKPFKLFLDDVRNPPVRERDWVVVRNVPDAIACMEQYGYYVTELSLDNDLGPDPQGIDFLKWILHQDNDVPFTHLTTITIHSGNLVKSRKMTRLGRDSCFTMKRKLPSDRHYPHKDHDKRLVSCFTKDKG